MSQEFRVQISVFLTSGNVQFQSQPNSFSPDWGGGARETPGYVVAALAGNAVDLTKITSPGGLCWVQNQDTAGSSNYAEVGTLNTTDSPDEFTPLIELLPGEFFVFRLSRFLGGVMGTASGTGLVSSTAQLWVKGVGGAVPLCVKAFDK